MSGIMINVVLNSAAERRLFYCKGYIQNERPIADI